jgi:enoyl-CoA hydratase
METISYFELNSLDIANLEKLYNEIKIFLKDKAKDLAVIKVCKVENHISEHIKLMNELNEKEAKKYILIGQSLFLTIYNAKKIVLGIADGYIFDGFFEILLACDLFFSTKKSEFGFPCINYGLIPAFGSLKLLCRGIFEQFVKYIVLTGAMINAEDLYNKGIINKLFENMRSCQKDIDALAKNFSNKSKFALGLAKESINHTLFASLEDALLIEQNAFCLSFSNDDRIEGIRAFLEKRRPNFKNRWEDIYNTL